MIRSTRFKNSFELQGSNKTTDLRLFGGIDLNYSSIGDTNGLFYYLGTNGYTTSFVNPALATEKIAAIDFSYDSSNSRNAPFISDRINNSSINTSAIYKSVYLDIARSNPQRKMSLKTIVIMNGFAVAGYKVKGTNDLDQTSTRVDIDNANWEVLVAFHSNENTADKVISIEKTKYYRSFMIENGAGLSPNDYRITEIELYGTLNTAIV